jgi:hypothetical protein
MSHHEHTDSSHIEHAAESEDNSTVDMYALLGLVLIVVTMAVYFVSR